MTTGVLYSPTYIYTTYFKKKYNNITLSFSNISEHSIYSNTYVYEWKAPTPGLKPNQVNYIGKEPYRMSFVWYTVIVTKH